MGNLTDNLDNSSMNSDNFERADERSARTRRFIPFYRPRKDNLSCFSEEKLMRTFRFDQTFIEYITRLNLT